MDFVFRTMELLRNLRSLENFIQLELIFALRVTPLLYGYSMYVFNYNPLLNVQDRKANLEDMVKQCMDSLEQIQKLSLLDEIKTDLDEISGTTTIRYCIF